MNFAEMEKIIENDKDSIEMIVIDYIIMLWLNDNAWLDENYNLTENAPLATAVKSTLSKIDLPQYKILLKLLSKRLKKSSSKKELKDVTQDELMDFICEFNLCLAPVAFSKPEIIGLEFHDDTIYFTYSQKSLKTNREVLTEGNISFGEEPSIYLEWESLVGQQRDILRNFELKHLGYWHNKGYSILDSILNPDSALFGGTIPVESVPIA